MRIHLYFLLILISLITSCSDKNIADCDGGKMGGQCSEKTPQEKAKDALNNDDPDAAIDILESYLADNPEDYSAYPLLSSAYACKSGFDIFNVAKGNLGSGGGGVIDTMGAFLPSLEELGEEEYDQRLVWMKDAVSRLEEMPEDHRKSSSEITYGASASFQYTLYQSAYSVMNIRKFTVTSADGGLDQGKLNQMTDEEATEILSSLSGAADNPLNGQGENVQIMVGEALQQIQSEEGDTDKEKLINFLQKNQQSPQ